MPPKKRKANAREDPAMGLTCSSPKKLKVTNGTPRKKSRAKEEEPTTMQAKLEAWFAIYADDENKDIIGPEGIERLCQDINLPLDSPTFLVLAYKLNAETMGYFSKKSWIEGMSSLQVNNSDQLRDVLPELDKALSNEDALKDLYKFAFGYAKTKGQKGIEVPVACVMWQLLLANKSPHVGAMTQFLEDVKPVKIITRDQYQNFYDFVSNMKEDLSNYDESSAWPVLFDEYTEWKKAQNK